MHKKGKATNSHNPIEDSRYLFKGWTEKYVAQHFRTSSMRPPRFADTLRQTWTTSVSQNLHRENKEEPL